MDLNLDSHVKLCIKSQKLISLHRAFCPRQSVASEAPAKPDGIPARSAMWASCSGNSHVEAVSQAHQVAPFD